MHPLSAGSFHTFGVLEYNNLMVILYVRHHDTAHLSELSTISLWRTNRGTKLGSLRALCTGRLRKQRHLCAVDEQRKNGAAAATPHENTSTPMIKVLRKNLLFSLPTGGTMHFAIIKEK